LKDARVAKALPLAEVARKTKIPERALDALENGRAEGLPADVFVRGFVSSYARVVGIDASEAMARYGEAARADRPTHPRSPSLASRLAPGISRTDNKETHRSSAASEAKSPSDSEGTRNQDDPPMRPPVAAPRSQSPEPSASSSLNDDESSASRYRVGLTFAVIVLVIIATLTLSFLLRRPQQEGDSASPVSSL
jgi:hypothetical protein